jgi:hypothetical protein
MSAAVPDFVQSAANLRRSLEDAADALAAADLPRLLECEGRIHAALTQIATSELTAEARRRLVDEIELTRQALTRCRRFGFALNDFVRISLTAQGIDDGYTRAGASVNADLRTIYRTA